MTTQESHTQIIFIHLTVNVLVKLVIHGPKFCWFSMDPPNFNSCMGTLVVYKSTDRRVQPACLVLLEWLLLPAISQERLIVFCQQVGSLPEEHNSAAGGMINGWIELFSFLPPWWKERQLHHFYGLLKPFFYSWTCAGHQFKEALNIG